MKFRRTVSSVVVSVLLAMAVLLAVLFFHASAYGLDRVREMVSSMIPQGDAGLGITMDSVDSTLMKGIRINGVHVRCDDGTEAVSVGNVDVSLSLLRLVFAALGIGNGHADVLVSDVSVLINDSTVQRISALASPSEDSSSGNDAELSADDSKGSSNPPFGKIGISVVVSDLSVRADYSGILAESSGINATAYLDRGLVLKSAAFNIPGIKASFSGSDMLTVNDIRASMGEDLVAYLSFADASFGDMVRIDSSSAIAAIRQGVASVALYVNDAGFDGGDMDLKASVNGTTVNASYGLESGILSFNIDVRQTSGSLKGADLDFSVDNLVLSGSYDGSETVSGNISSMEIGASVSDCSVRSRGLAGEFSFNPTNLSALGQVTMVGSGIRGLEGAGISSLELTTLTVDFSYSDSAMGARVRSAVKGNMESPLVKDFSFDLEANARLDGDLAIESADVALNDIRMEALDRSASVSVVLPGEGQLHGEIRSSNNLSAFFGYSEGQVSFNMYLSNLLPYGYKGIYESVLKPLDVVTEKTAVNGNVVVNASLDGQFSDFIETVLKGKPGKSPEDMDVFKLIRSGRVSINTAVRDLSVGNTLRSGAVSFESALDSGLATIETLAVTTEGLRLSYEGTLEIAELIPDGKLILQNASDGSELAHMDFSHEKGMRSYDFSLVSPLVEDSSLTGSVNWQDLESIEADVKIKAPVLGPMPVNVKANASVNPAHISFEGDLISLRAALDDAMIDLTGELRHMMIYPSDSLSVEIDGSLGGFFNTSSSEYGLTLTDFSALLSNGMGVGFDLNLTNSSIKVTNASLDIDSVHHDLYGSMDFRFKDIPSLLKLRTKGLEGKMDFTSISGLSRLHASVVDDQFYLDMRYNDNTQDGLVASLSALGQRDSAFYGKADVSWGKNNRFDFNIMYDDLVVTIYDSKGNLGSLQVNDINFVADFTQMILDGSVKVKNENLFKTGDLVTQAATFTINTKVESLSDSIIQIISGQDYSVDFTMGISDVVLADDYKVDDAKLNINLSNGNLSMSGNMLKGEINLDSGYVDVRIADDFLFGFKAKGYVGKELDLIVTDISFPLPILNQFINSPDFGFKDGHVSGDVLITGKLSNPSFYGMAYCQSYEMTLFYLPDQVVSVKNVVVSMNNHVMSVSRTPMSGYSEADGRYFFGDVAVDMVMQQGAFESFNVRLNINKNTPIDFWYPNVSGFEMDVHGNVTGYLDYIVYPNRSKMTADIHVTNTQVSLRLQEEVPQWYYPKEGSVPQPFELDVTMTTGQNIEFYYPEKDNSFINFTVAEDNKVRLIIDENNVFKVDGGFALKTGQVYYFQNDFIIREGSADLTARNLTMNESDFPLILNLTADITDYDSDGNKVVISLILKNATLDNLNPRFSSTPMKTENEILAMLGQSVLSSSSLDQSLSLSSIASLAATATDALTRVGILESNKSYSLSSIVRNSLGLDIFSARSNIIPNVLIDALPGEISKKGEVSMLARYLDGTSIFAGKYLTSEWFVKIRLMLKAETRNNTATDFGHFLAKDLILDTEVSLDWDTPMGTVSIFTNPHELSVFDILDTIGFSVTKQIQF